MENQKNSSETLSMIIDRLEELQVVIEKCLTVSNSLNDKVQYHVDLNGSEELKINAHCFLESQPDICVLNCIINDYLHALELGVDFAVREAYSIS